MIMNTPKIENGINPEIKRELEKINTFAYSSLNQESVATWLIIKALANGSKSWSELEKTIDIGTSTLSRKLKKMQKQKFVKRKIIPSFPPRTAYELDKETYPELVDDLVIFTKEIEKVEKVIINELSINLNTQKIKRNKELLKELGESDKELDPNIFNSTEDILNYMFKELEVEIYYLFRLILSNLEASSPLWSTYFAMIFMQQIAAIAKHLSVTSEMKKEAQSIINCEAEEKYREWRSIWYEKKLTKNFPKSYIRPISSKETKAFFESS
jgi:DNA-binding HxlR family transcriptional regulator